MPQVLVKKGVAADRKSVFGVIELSEGEGYYLAEFDKLPVDPHLPQTYEFFDDNETVDDLETKYRLDLSEFKLIKYQPSE
jgi:Mor family transcriptional regulator